MLAAVNRSYGPPGVVQVRMVPTPRVRPGHVLVRVEASAVTAADSRLRGARFPSGFGVLARLGFGIRRPRTTILGSSFAGAVEAVGSGVDEGVEIGTPVGGLSGGRFGAHAEFVLVPAKRVVLRPDPLSAADAAGLLFGGTTALYFLRDRAAVREGQSVLVIGASGAVGTNAVQLARYFGATVTAVTSAGNLDLARQLGATAAIDYTRTPAAAISDRFDVVFDTIGTLSPRQARSLLTPGGVALLAAADLWQTLAARGPVKTGVTPERAADVELLFGLAAEGRLLTVIDRTGGLDDIAALHERVDSGRKVGNVILLP